VKPARTQPCYQRTRDSHARPGEGCWPQNKSPHTHRVRLLVETMGGPSWQTVHLCDKHRRDAEAAGLAKGAPR
jgi:hypothetical protein